ncbi:alanine racemase [Corynebacterium sp. MSK041]|uniref:alanine racemase n=1 Tax=Corynebacterium sp. MSK041 TaxID=3050194 RepID=UPI0025508217|nr:alanine racemase [Corynebacterium sp. MSK041]MDK8795551.1 alanine racemase [Corynebacterium sp. MSK041]
MSPATLTIDLGAIAHNTAVMKRVAGDAKLMCVVKANAYNHGAQRVIPVMDAAGADAFGVATLTEAAQIRPLTDKPVLAWIWQPGEEIPAGIEVGVPGLEHLRWLVEQGEKRPVHLIVDTGLNRSGIDEEDWPEAFDLAAASGLQVRGLMSHFACADEPTHPHNQVQRDAFQRAIALARTHGLEVPVNHLANSPGTLTGAENAFGMVRPGIALYGLDPLESSGADLHPAMTLSAGLTAVKRIKKGEGASYSLTWTAPEDGWTAIVPVGYADGILRAWQDHIEVTIGGQRYSQVGRVCMDQFIVWLGSDRAGINVGDQAIIFGPGGMSAAELARRVGTIHYEVVCAPGGRVVREYVDKQESHEATV